MDDVRTTNKIAKPAYTINDLRRDPKVRWRDDVKNDKRRMGMNWRKVAQDRDGWRYCRDACTSWIVEPYLKRKILQFFPLLCTFLS